MIFFPGFKKKNISHKKTSEGESPKQLGDWVPKFFPSKKNPRKDERGAFLDILEVDPKNAQALRQNLDLKKLQKKKQTRHGTRWASRYAIKWSYTIPRSRGL